MTESAKEKPDGFTPSKVGQIGMVVRDARSSAEYFSRLYNIRPWFRAKFTEKQTFFRGKEIDLDADILLGFCGGVEIELIQLNDDTETIYSDILRKQNGGIHHIGFFIKGLDEKVSAIKAKGAEPLQWGRLKTRGGAVTRYAYFDTVKTCGAVTEYIETKFLGLTMPHMQALVKFSELTGDVERI